MTDLNLDMKRWKLQSISSYTINYESYLNSSCVVCPYQVSIEFDFFFDFFFDFWNHSSRCLFQSTNDSYTTYISDVGKLININYILNNLL